MRFRIRYHWAGKKKYDSHAFGIDIKYNQLTRLAPVNWNATCPFIVSYLRSREVILIHTTRNIIHCVISAMIASQRNLWHNYDGVLVNHPYEIDIAECLRYARTIVRDQNKFLKCTDGCSIVNCRYENLIDDLKRAGPWDEIPEGPGPLWDIAAALKTPFHFRDDRRLQKAINVPYSRLLSNYDALLRRLENSEFSVLVPTLE